MSHTTNQKVAAVFDEMADLLDIQGANPFRVRAYRNAARTMQGLGKDVSDLVAQGLDLKTLPGIGKDLAAKIVEIRETGSLKALEALRTQVPPSLEELLQIPGLGPRRVQSLYNSLNVQTLDGLEHAIRAGKLRELHGFGVKIEQQILAAITARRRKKPRHLRTDVAPQAEAFVAYLERNKAVEQLAVAGSFRRGKDTVGDLDVLACARQPRPVVEHFTSYPEVGRITSQGTTRAAVVLKSDLNVDLRIVEPSSFGSALQYFTGSKAHGIQVRRLAQSKNLKLNEYGVFRGSRRIAGRTEASVYRALGLALIPPELREAHDEIDAARERRLPTLIELNDLQGDLHVHTAASDGHAPLPALAKAAKKCGLGYIAITDHSQHLAVAHGLNAKRLHQQIEEIDAVNEQLKGFTLLKGIEVDILEDGDLDLPDHVLSKLDLVVGAIHDHLHLSRKKQTERALRAMDHRYFSILAHPTGRLLSRREPYPIDVPRVIEQARQRGCFLELNSQPQRLDITENGCRLARDQGVLIAINSDAHTPGDFANLRHGVLQGRRGWLEKNDVLNARPLGELLELLAPTMLGSARPVR